MSSFWSLLVILFCLHHVKGRFLQGTDINGDISNNDRLRDLMRIIMRRYNGSTVHDGDDGDKSSSNNNNNIDDDDNNNNNNTFGVSIVKSHEENNDTDNDNISNDDEHNEDNNVVNNGDKIDVDEDENGSLQNVEVDDVDDDDDENNDVLMTTMGRRTKRDATRTHCRNGHFLRHNDHINHRSTCPWHFVEDADVTRYPSILPTATLTCGDRCLALNSRGRFVQDSDENLRCLPLYKHRRVTYFHSLNDAHAHRPTSGEPRYENVTEWLPVPVGFTCGFP